MRQWMAAAGWIIVLSLQTMALGEVATTQAVAGTRPDAIVSPMICGANAMYEFAGMYYGTLPKTDPRSRRAEFITLLHEKGIRALRFPGGTPALSQFLVDNDAMMQKVFGAAGIPEGDPNTYTTFWQFLDFCREAKIEPIYQVNTAFYCDGAKVYQIAGPKNCFGMAAEAYAANIVFDHSQRDAAAKALTALARQVRDRGFAVRHWELGNEEYGHPVMDAGDYADVAIRFTQAIREADPNAMVWATLGSNHCGDTSGRIAAWSRSALKAWQKAGLTSDRHFGFTLHYVWPEYIELHTTMVKAYGFRPRFAVTEFHMAGAGPYWDLSPRYGYALGLANYLISMARYPSVEILCIHELTSQNFGIFHYNQRSYGLPDMSTWDASLGYQSMPSAYVYELFGQLVGGRIVTTKKATQANLLVVELGSERRVFYVNPTVNPVTVNWHRGIVGRATKSFECQSIVPNLKPEPAKDETGVPAQALGQSNQNVDPLRVDRVEKQTQSGTIADGGLTLTLPSYSVSVIRCRQ